MKAEGSSSLRRPIFIRPGPDIRAGYRHRSPPSTPWRWNQACADACLNAQPLPNSQLGQNLAKPGWNCHHDNFKDSNPNVEWKATLEQAEKIGMGTRQYTLKKI